MSLSNMKLNMHRDSVLTTVVKNDFCGIGSQY